MDASPRVGDGLIRLDADGIVQYASPNALSAYHRLGLAADLVGHHLGRTTAELAPSRGPVDEALAKVASGWAPREFEIEANDGVIQFRAIPLKPKGTRIGSLVLLPRRHRTAPPRTRVDHQGRHHPGDPPPGEEQPPDGGRPAPPPGPAHRVRPGPRGAGGGGAPGRLDRDRARDAVPEPGRAGGVRRDRRPGAGDGRGDLAGQGRPAGAPAASASWTPRSPPRCRWC